MKNLSNSVSGAGRYEVIIDSEHGLVRGTQREFVVQFRCPRKLGLIGLARFLAREVANLLILIVNYDTKHYFNY